MDIFFLIFQIIIHLHKCTKYYLSTNHVLDVGTLTEGAQQENYILHFNCKQATTGWKCEITNATKTHMYECTEQIIINGSIRNKVILFSVENR